MNVSISQESIHHQLFYNSGITEFSKTATIAPTAESQKRYEEMCGGGGRTPDAVTGQANIARSISITENSFMAREHNRATFLAAEGGVSSVGLLASTISEGGVSGTKAKISEALESLEATTPSGVHVKVERSFDNVKDSDDPVYRITLNREGEDPKEFLTNKDVRITELENGEYEIVPLGEGESILNGTDGDDIIITRSASSVLAGGGDDTIFAMWGEGGGTYDGGAGNDQFILAATSKNVTIFGGSGDDSVRSSFVVEGANIDLGDGANSFDANLVFNSIVKGGDGNNTVNANWYTGGEIAFGGGQNAVAAQGVLSHTSLDLGNGNNTVSAHTIMSSSVNTGDGNNRLAFQMAVNSDISTGDGKNGLFIGISNGSRIAMGNGGNQIYIGGITPDGKTNINLGDGDDSVYIGNLPEGASPHINLGGDSNVHAVNKRAQEARQDLYNDQADLPKSFDDLILGIFRLDNHR